MRSQKALFGLAALLGLAVPAFSAPIITLTDSVGDPSSATVAPGGTFSVNVAVVTDAGTTGFTYFLQASTTSIFTLTGRTMAATSPFTDITTSDASLGIPLVLNPPTSKDLGYTSTTPDTNTPAGTLQIATLTFTISPSAVGSYTLFTTSSSVTNSDFDTIPATEAVYTVSVPEPTSLSLIAVGGLLLGRRRR